MKVVGGVKLDEFVVDLVVVVSVVFSYCDKLIRSMDCFIGEFGFIGEICCVVRIE